MKKIECPLSSHARESKRSIAITSPSTSWTYFSCNELVEGIASTLRSRGVKAGDRITLFPTQHFLSPLIFFALFRLGAIACPLSPHLPLALISQILDTIDSSLLLTQDDTICFKVKKPILLCSQLIRVKAAPSHTFLYEEAHATYLFTSGTTAQPKIACHSLGNHYYSALGSNVHIPLTQGDCYLLSLPLYHIAGIAILFRTFLAGATLLLSHEIDHSDATHLSLVPTQLYRLMRAPIHTLPKHILLGGAPISYNLYMKAKKKGLMVHPTYGMTEMSSQISTHNGLSPFSLGHPLLYREIKIAEDGEICVRGATLFQGYFTKQEGCVLPLDGEGWFCTKDLGTYFPQIGLQFLGRKDRLFISGGENIYPEEIETILEEIEEVERAKVVPVPDNEFGMRPVAYIKSVKKHNEQKLRNFLSSKLPKYKVPLAFFSLDDVATKYYSV